MTPLRALMTYASQLALSGCTRGFDLHLTLEDYQRLTANTDEMRRYDVIRTGDFDLQLHSPCGPITVRTSLPLGSPA